MYEIYNNETFGKKEKDKIRSMKKKIKKKKKNSFYISLVI